MSEREEEDLMMSMLSPQPKGHDLDREIDRYDREVLEASAQKSYIYKLAEKGGRKNHGEKLKMPEHEREGMLRSTFKPKGNRINFNAQTKDQTYEVLMTPIGKPAGGFNICCDVDCKQLVRSTLTVSKQLSVVDHEGKEIYYFNLNTIAGQIDDPKSQPEAPFTLFMGKGINLKFSEGKSSSTFIKFKRNLKNAVAKSLGVQHGMKDLLEVEDFEKIKYKPVTQFSEHCQTGDILLFQGNHFFAKAQRLFTGSDYDHVGMVIRDPVYGILIFESNSTSGVCLTPWELLIKYKWYKFIQRVVWRKLSDVNRDKNFINLVHSFVTANLGKSYYISMQKLLSNNSYIAKGTEDVGYFCSELVAAVYKDLQLLTRDKSSKDYKPNCNFYPKHFTSRVELNLLQGKLSEEYVIHFNDEEVDSYYQF